MSSVGYLVLSSLGDPLVETWKFSPSHHGTRPDPNLVGRMVISSLATMSSSENNNNNKFSSKSTTLRISLNSNADDDEQQKQQDEEGDEDDDFYNQNQQHYLHIFAMEFYVKKMKFISVNMRIITTNINEEEEKNHQDSSSLPVTLSTKSWCEVASLAIWFTSILIIEWLNPLSENIESISQAEHKEEKFTTDKVLSKNNKTTNSNNADDDESNVVLNKVIRMFHSDTLLLNHDHHYSPENLPEMSLNSVNNNNKHSAVTTNNHNHYSPQPARSTNNHQHNNNNNVNVKSTNHTNNNNNTAMMMMMNTSLSPSARSTRSISPAASGKMKFNNSLSVGHEVFLMALRVCLINAFEKEQKQNNNKKSDDNKDDDDLMKKQRTNGKAVTGEADIILNDLQQQILVKQENNLSKLLMQDDAIVGIALVKLAKKKIGNADDKNKTSPSSSSLWLLQPKIIPDLKVSEEEEKVDANKWKFTICSRLLKLIEKQMESALTKKNDVEGKKIMDNVKFSFLGDQIKVTLNEIRIEQDEEEYFSSISLLASSGKDNNNNNDEWKVVIVNLSK